MAGLVRRVQTCHNAVMPDTELLDHTAAEPTSSLERMLRILDVIEDTNAAVPAEDLAARLGFTRSTTYRYLKILAEAGLVSSLPDLGYTLGPRIAELDWRMRTADPLIQAGRPVMAELARGEAGVVLLCRRYRDLVLCVHQERGSDLVHSFYERGRARPPVRGAASRVILAWLPPPQLARLHARHTADFAAAGLGDTLAAARTRLRAIRLAGWDATEGQVTPGVTGIAAPILDGSGGVLGSLNLTVPRIALSARERARIADRVVLCAGIIARAAHGPGATPGGGDAGQNNPK